MMRTADRGLKSLSNDDCRVRSASLGLRIETIYQILNPNSGTEHKGTKNRKLTDWDLQQDRINSNEQVGL